MEDFLKVCNFQRKKEMKKMAKMRKEESTVSIENLMEIRK